MARFLRGALDFPGITALCAEAVARHTGGPSEPDLPELLELDHEVRAWAATFGRSEASHTS